MGNAQQAGYNRDQNQSIQAIKGWPLLFHQTHSTNIQLNSDQRRAKRLETFCNGICFSNRPVSIGEQVILRFAEVSSSWSGVLRFGFTSHDPTTINASTLPRYACPDLTNKYGYWAKALPERFALQGNILCFHVCRSGNVMYTVNGEDKGLFFGSVMTSQPLWALIDIYGNTTSIEFIDPRLILSLPLKDSSSSPTLTSGSNFFLPIDTQQLNNSQARPLVPLAHHQSLGHAPSQALLEHRANNQNLHQYNYRQQQHKLCSAGGRSSNHSSSLPDMTLTPVSAPPPVRHHKNLTTLQFHSITGKNVQLSSDGTVAARLTDEYCNGYVFSSRPIKPGEKIVVQVLLLDNVFTGGIAFGMTSCDISTLTPSDLPDDADLLLDRLEYWVVNKDVCSNAVVGDELSFYFTIEGEIKYGRNGLHMSTLMHVDKEVKLWAFFDIYGQTQKIKLLGVTTPSSSSLPTTGSLHGRPTQQTDSNDGTFQNMPDFLTMSALPSSVPFVFSLPVLIDTSADGDVPPPRPPPPVKKATNHLPGQSQIPALPPKQSRPTAGASDTTAAVPQLLTPSRVALENGGIASQRPQDQVALPRPIVSGTPRHVFSPPLSAPSNASLAGHRMFQIPSKSDSLRLKSSPLAPVLAPKPGTPLRGSATFRFSRPFDAADVSSTSLPFQVREGKVASHNRTGTSQFIPDIATPTPVPRTTVIASNSRSENNHQQQGSQSSVTVQSGKNGSNSKDNFLGECSVCLERVPDCALYMCGHMCMCYDCAIALKESRDAQCPICRQPIKDIIKIYRS